MAQEQPDETRSISDQVNQTWVTELQEMGFTKEVGEKALFLTQNASLEAAMNWIEEHQGDPDFLEELRIVGTSAPSGPKLTPQEAAAKARELQERLRKKRQEEEKKLELEQERNRLRMGKELNMARQQYEDAEAKRIADARLREKQLREKELADIKEQVRRDKEARFGKSFASEEGKSQVSQRDQMANAAKAIKTLYPQFRNPDVARTALSTLRVYLNNLLSNPGEDKFRRIKKDNRAFQDRIAKVTGGLNFLKAAGFREDGDFWVMGEIDSALLSDGVRMLEETLAGL